MNMLRPKILLVLIIVCFSIDDAFSSYGFKFGVISTKFEYVPEFSSSQTLYDENRIGPTFGILTRYCDLGYINIESEIYYLQKGGQETVETRSVFKPEGTGEFITLDVHFNYLQLQTSVRPKIDFDAVGIYGLLGVSINYLLSVNNTGPRTEFSDFVFSYAYGVGIEFNKLIDQTVFIELLVNSDLTNIYQDSEREYKFNTLMLRLGIAIN